MTLRDDEWRLLRETALRTVDSGTRGARRPDDGALRRVLADRLLEADDPLGELLQLEAEQRDLPRRRALEVELRKALEVTLVPWASELELDRGLPWWASFDTSIGRRHLLEEREPWPIPTLTVTGSFPELLSVLASPVLERVRHLDLSRLRAPALVLPARAPVPVLAPLLELETVALPAGRLPDEWRDVLRPAFARVKVLEVGVGPGFELERWWLEFPALERLRLVPSREPGDGSVFSRAQEWAEERKGPCLEWLGELHDAASARHEWTPGLPGDRPVVPEERHERLELDAQLPGGRVLREREGSRVFLRSDDAPAADVFAAPTHRSLVSPLDLVRIRRALHVELREAGKPCPLSRQSVGDALRLASEFATALRAWWSQGAPDVLTGEWVALGRDQLRLRDDGALALVPALTRRMGPEAHHLIDVVGVPFLWNRTEPTITQLTAAAFIEWVTGVSFLEARHGSATAVHRRLVARLAHPPSVHEFGARGDDVLRRALEHPRELPARQLLDELARLNALE